MRKVLDERSEGLPFAVYEMLYFGFLEFWETVATYNNYILQMSSIEILGISFNCLRIRQLSHYFN